MMVHPNFRRAFGGKGPFPAPYDGMTVGAEGEHVYQVIYL